MKPTPLIILAMLLVALLIALSPFIFVVIVLYGFAEFIKYYLPSKHAKKLSKIKEKSPSINSFKIDFLREKDI